MCFTGGEWMTVSKWVRPKRVAEEEAVLLAVEAPLEAAGSGQGAACGGRPWRRKGAPAPEWEGRRTRASTSIARVWGT